MIHVHDIGLKPRVIFFNYILIHLHLENIFHFFLYFSDRNKHSLTTTSLVKFPLTYVIF